MADLGGTFDPGAVSDDREVLPAGDAPAQIFESDLVATKAGNGQMLKLGWEIIGGPLQGRKLWSNVNVQNSSAQAQEIGQRELKRICDAAGTGPIRNSDALHHKPLIISIVIKPAGPGRDGKTYDASNEIKGYKPYGAAITTATMATYATAAVSAPNAAVSALPWPSR